MGGPTGELLARAQSTNGAVGQSSSLSETAVGDGGGEVVEPSTWMMEVQCAGDTGDTAFRFFLALVIMGKMTGQFQKISKFRRERGKVFKKSQGP